MKMPKDARSRRNQLFLLALIVVGIGVFVLFTNIDRAMLRQTLDETYTYVETRLHLYEVDAANDRIKSLTRPHRAGRCAVRFCRPCAH